MFLRQSIIGGNYGLLRDTYWDKNITDTHTILANPDYFSAVLFKRYMGNAVFATVTPTATTDTSGSSVLVFAHCARQHEGGLAVAIINFDTVARPVTIDDAHIDSSSARMDYIMESAGGEGEGPYSQYAKLNGGSKRLETAADLIGQKGTGGASLVLPPQSYGVVVFPEAGVKHC